MSGTAKLAELSKEQLVLYIKKQSEKTKIEKNQVKEQIDAKEREVTELKERVNDLEEELSKCNEEKNREINQLKEQVAAAAASAPTTPLNPSSTSDENKDSDKATATIAKLRGDINTLRKSEKKLKADLASAKEEIAQRSESNISSSSDDKGIVAELEEQIFSLNDQLSAAEKLAQTNARSLENTKKSYVDLQNALQALTEEISSNAVSTVDSVANSSFSDLRSKVAVLIEEKDAANSLVESLKGKLASAKVTLTNRKAQLGQLQEELDTLKAVQSATQGVEDSDFATKLSASEELIVDLQKKLEISESLYQESASSNTDLHKKIADTLNLYADATLEIEKLKEELRTVSSSLEDLNDDSSKNINSLQEKLAEQENLYTDACRRLEELNAELATSKSSESSNTATLSEEHHIETLKCTLEESENKYKQVCDELDSLKQQLKETSEFSVVTKKEYDDSVSIVSSLQAQIDILESDRKSQQELISDLQTKYSNLETTSDDSIKNCSRMDSKLASLKELYKNSLEQVKTRTEELMYCGQSLQSALSRGDILKVENLSLKEKLLGKDLERVAGSQKANEGVGAEISSAHAGSSTTESDEVSVEGLESSASQSNNKKNKKKQKGKAKVKSNSSTNNIGSTSTIAGDDDATVDQREKTTGGGGAVSTPLSCIDAEYSSERMAELLEEYKMVIGELTMSRQTMENIMADLQSRLKDLLDDTASKDVHISQLEAELSEVSSSVRLTTTTLNSSTQSLEANIASMRQVEVEISKKLAEKSSEATALREETTALREETTLLRERIVDLEDTLKATQNKLPEVEAVSDSEGVVNVDKLLYHLRQVMSEVVDLECKNNFLATLVLDNKGNTLTTASKYVT